MYLDKVAPPWLGIHNPDDSLTLVSEPIKTSPPLGTDNTTLLRLVFAAKISVDVAAILILPYEAVFVFSTFSISDMVISFDNSRISELDEIKSLNVVAPFGVEINNRVNGASMISFAPIGIASNV